MKGALIDIKKIKLERIAPEGDSFKMSKINSGVIFVLAIVLLLLLSFTSEGAKFKFNGIGKSVLYKSTLNVGFANDVNIVRRNAEQDTNCPFKTECDCDVYDAGHDLW